MSLSPPSPAPHGATDRVTICRICHGEHLTPVLDLGEQASADHFPPADDPGPDPRWPLALMICADCALVQLAYRSPEEEEPRAVESATSRTHAAAMAPKVAAGAGLDDAAAILECSSSHGGSWASALTSLGYAVTADRLDDERTYDLVIDNHSMIHDEDTDGAFAARVAHVAPDGTFAIEFHHALPFLTRTQFDTIRHGHPVYLSLHAWSALCTRHGFVVVDAWPEDVYGGCLVVLARRTGAPTPRVGAILAAEREAGLTSAAGFVDFADRAKVIGDALRAFLQGAAERGEQVAAYGAGSKAALLLGASGIDADLLPVTADLAPAKQGRRIPGTSIAILSPQQLVARRPHQVVILLWDLADEVVAQLREAGLTETRFVVPAPQLRVI